MINTIFGVIFQSTLPVRGGTVSGAVEAHAEELFQSTLPVRGGTISPPVSGQDFIFQSTLPVRGGTDEVALMPQSFVISIHPPREGRDGTKRGSDKFSSRFQSTLPVRGGTHERQYQRQ